MPSNTHPLRAMMKMARGNTSVVTEDMIRFGSHVLFSVIVLLQ
jgi:hypothetical protein